KHQRDAHQFLRLGRRGTLLTFGKLIRVPGLNRSRGVNYRSIVKILGRRQDRGAVAIVFSRVAGSVVRGWLPVSRVPLDDSASLIRRAAAQRASREAATNGDE